MIVGVVLAAGNSTRFGTLKQEALIGGVSVMDRALDTAIKMCDRVILVHNGGGLLRPDVIAVEGGDTRSQSVRAALDFIDAPYGEFDQVHDIIVVHDAARCLATPIVWSRVIRAVEDDAICAVPTIPISDTIRHRAGAPADRDQFWIVQTPQAFRAATLFELHEDEPECSDDAGLLTLGVTFVPGDPSNIKITHPGDLAIAAGLLRSM